MVIACPSRPLRFSAPVLLRAGVEVVSYSEGLSAVLSMSGQSLSAILAPTDMEGVDVLRFVEAVTTRSNVPVIVGLTGTDESHEAGYRALEGGARALLGLPCADHQLATLARSVGLPPVDWSPPLVVGPLVLHRAAYEVTVDSIPIHFTPREIQFLEHLMMEAPRVVAVEDLAELFAGADGPRPSAVRKLVARVRRKLNAARPGLLMTVHGVGYRIAAASPAPRPKG